VRIAFRSVAAATVGALVLAACSPVLNGHPTIGNAPNANLKVHGDSGDAFDTTAKNAVSDVTDFWAGQYPKISGGRRFPPLRGGLYSVDGVKVANSRDVGAARAEACVSRSPTFIVDNGAFCTLDDSIVWDRAPSHLFAQLAQKYGPLLVALIFAHEFGHAVQYRLGILRRNLPTIDTESQADCAAGAWAATALHGKAAHFRDVSPQKLDAALEGFLDGRDGTPTSVQDISHGNGFDRLSAVADGIARGVTYCYSDNYFASRTFTERTFTDPNDYAAGGNEPLSEVLKSGPKNSFVKDLNRFWTHTARTVGKTFSPVTIAAAARPPCATSSANAFAYCPGDNAVYYNPTFARQAYNSLPGVVADPSNGNITLSSNQPADFALGVLLAIAWGMAVRHQLFGRTLDGHDALLAAVCYTGAYAKDVNVPSGTPGKDITLSPADLDEATSSVLDQVGKPQAFGARGTTGLDRIKAFVKGYRDGLSSC
jgi:predicted metalloprotease